MKNAPEIYHFTDDGIIPNSKHPLLLFRDAFQLEAEEGAAWLEGRFAENNWTNSFRWRIYDFHHYHSNTHEVLGVFAGTALLQLGGPQGERIRVKPGAVIILPAGTGHISLEHSEDFEVIGAYPDGTEPDLIRITDERPKGVREKVDAVALPENDPLYGRAENGLLTHWKV